ncbi:protein PSK SIMULATOR 3-like [Salvia miltiorrhiza]|uniref:protein PSK SIMULATOR 3-like n=1 Tax=Salvia miltiorrhiza TaxID=226208 RepID=UPI0025AC5F8E|nr:protein PSK SIMULATOR 3-like [Salvia miltiorrhiza]
MVAETWILRMGNQVSSNLKHALYSDNNSTKSLNKKQNPSHERQIIGILSFEVANVMSKIMNLHKSLSDNEVSRLKNEILKSDGIRTLVSSDEKQLLELALVEKLDDLSRIAGVVSRLGKKCSIPALQGFEHVYGDVVSGVIDVGELSFLVKDMEGMMRKMERYVTTTVSLYSEMEVMNELESATKKFRENQHEESRKAFEQKLMWQRQDVKHLQDVSLWNQTFDKAMELLARTVCTVYARIHLVFGDGLARAQDCSNGSSQRLKQLDVVRRSLRKHASTRSNGYSHSRAFVNDKLEKRAIGYRPKVRVQKGEGVFGPEDFNFVCGIGPGRMLMECLSLSSSASKVDDDGDRASYDDHISQVSGISVANSGKSDGATPLSSLLRPMYGERVTGEPKNRLVVVAPPNTVGGSALSLHYANVMIIIEKLLCYPHLVGEEARDDLYQMLPTSLRRTLKARLRSYSKNVAIYDAPLAHDWRERLEGMLKWLGPLAHNTIKWQSERNFEQQQQQIVTRTNVLLLQTLCYADRGKTEEAICELLVGLNYICRYEQQQNALLDCASSFDFDDCVDWHLQPHPSFHS